AHGVSSATIAAPLVPASDSSGRVKRESGRPAWAQAAAAPATVGRCGHATRPLEAVFSGKAACQDLQARRPATGNAERATGWWRRVCRWLLLRVRVLPDLDAGCAGTRAGCGELPHAPSTPYCPGGLAAGLPCS